MSSELLLQTLQHLSQAAKIVDGDNRTNKLLNCYYLSRIQSLAAAENNLIEQSSSSSCIKCATSFRDSNNFSLSIKHRKIRKGKHKKLNSNERSGSKFKKKRLGQKYKKSLYNVAEITCKLCNFNNKTSIRFDTKNKTKTKTNDPPIIQSSELEFTKPSKRKREKNAGLILKDKKLRPENVVSSKPVAQPIKVVPGKCNKAKKSKNFTAEKNKKNITSAQKQRKGILLLANVLKMNDQKQQNSQSKLSKMFK